MKKVILLLSLLAQCAWMSSAGPIKPVSDDLWDISKGNVITRTSGSFRNRSALFGAGGQEFIPESTYTYFGDSRPAPFVHFMEWRTPSPVTIQQIRFFAVGDYPSTYRELASIQIKAKSFGSATFDQIVLSYTPPTHPYTFLDPTEWLLVDQAVANITAQEFRAEVVQYQSGASRIREIDAFGLVLEPITITSHPASTNVNIGANVEFSVQATGPGQLTYQWFQGGMALTNEITSALTLSNVVLNHAGEYYVRISNGNTLATSEKARLTVTNPNTIKPTSNDLWDVTQGVSLTAQSGPFWNVMALFGEKGHEFIPENTYMYFGDGTPAPYVHYLEWHTPAPVRVDSIRLFAVGDYPDTFREFTSIVIKAKTFGSSTFDQTLLSLTPTHPYTFVDTNEWFLLEQAVDGVVAQEFRAEVVQYGSGQPRIRELDAFGTVVEPITIISHPVSKSVFVGQAASFSVTATGPSPLTYQWYHNDQPLTNQTSSTLTISNAKVESAGTYHAVVTSPYSNRSSEDANLIVYEPRSVKPTSNDLWDISQGITITKKSGEFWNLTGLFGFNGHAFVPEETYMYFGDGRSAPFVHFLEWKTTSPVTIEKIRLFAVGDYPSTFREFTSFTIKAKSLGSDTFDQVLFSITPTHPYTFLDASEWFLSEQHVKGVTAQEFRAEMVQFGSGQPRIRELDAFGTQASPIFIQSPIGGVYNTGSSITLNAEVSGQGPVSYEWFKDGKKLEGANSSSLTISTPDDANTGLYKVVATTPAGQIESSAFIKFASPLDSQVTTLAGSSPGYLDSNNPLQAQFRNPDGIAVDGNGNIYVADTHNHVIRRVRRGGAVTTLAGQDRPGRADGEGSASLFNYPLGLTRDENGDLWVADTENDLIRKIFMTPETPVITFAGSDEGYVNELAFNAKFNFPNDLVVDHEGNVFVTEFNNHTIRRISPDGQVSTFAGSGTLGYADGIGESAQFNQPAGIAIDRAGNLYVTEWSNHRVRKITPNRVVSTLAGTGQPGFQDGAMGEATLNIPNGIAVTSKGYLVITESGNHAIRLIYPDGYVRTLGGTGSPGTLDGPGGSAQFNAPGGLTVAGDDSVLVADTLNHRIRKITWNSGFVPTPDGHLRIELSPSLVVTGQVGSTYLIEATDGLGIYPWINVGMVTLAGPSERWFDSRPVGGRSRSYRAVKLEQGFPPPDEQSIE